MNVHLFSLASCFVGASVLLAAELSGATSNPVVIEGGLVFGITDESESNTDPMSEWLKDSRLISTNLCLYLIHNRGSNGALLFVPRGDFSPFKIELKDRNGGAIPMTRLGIEVSKAPKITNPRWRTFMPWYEGTSWRSFLTSWATEPDKWRVDEFPNINQYFKIKSPGDYFATVRVRYWTRTNTTWFENLSAPATFIWHVPATNAPVKK